MSSTPQTFDAPLAFKKKRKSVEKMAKNSKNAIFDENWVESSIKPPKIPLLLSVLVEGLVLKNTGIGPLQIFWKKCPKMP